VPLALRVPQDQKEIRGLKVQPVLQDPKVKQVQQVHKVSQVLQDPKGLLEMLVPKERQDLKEDPKVQQVHKE
jgi:hypothetical protein